jgi:hypothetical protein
MTEAGQSVRLTIPARAEYITLGRLALTAIAGVRPVSDDSELEEGGLGIEIIRALADEVEIGPRGDGGSKLRFVKLLADR